MGRAALQEPVRSGPGHHRHEVERLDLLRPQERPGAAVSRKAGPGTKASPDPRRPAPVRKLRCAVYTRKSSEEGLDQEFNSLDAQREACEAYAASQKAEGWILVPDHYDDGGVSGA